MLIPLCPPDVRSVQVVEFDCVVVQVLIVCDCVSVCRLGGGGPIR